MVPGGVVPLYHYPKVQVSGPLRLVVAIPPKPDGDFPIPAAKGNDTIGWEYRDNHRGERLVELSPGGVPTPGVPNTIFGEEVLLPGAAARGIALNKSKKRGRRK